MSINTNILEKMQKIEEELAQIDDPTKPHPIADEVRNKALRAILGSAADWVIYMQLFAKTPEELARLIPTDGTHNDEEKNIARAYLAANGMCAPGTGKHLGDNVLGILNPPE
jgi:hypothetical protein